MKPHLHRQKILFLGPNGDGLSLLPNDLDSRAIPVIEGSDLIDISFFTQFYLNGKILGVSMPLKTILSKCIAVGRLKVK